MKKPRQLLVLNKVTPLSKALAMFLFILFPFLGFLLGMQYQRSLDRATLTEVTLSQN